MKKVLSALLASAICVGMIPFSAFASETVTVEKSDALYFSSNGETIALPDTCVTGEISVVVHEHPVEVMISKHSQEAPAIEYYHTVLQPLESGEDVTYTFLVDYCESPESTEGADQIFTTDFLENSYTSAYTVTLMAEGSDDAIYTENGVVIGDPHDESAVTGKTKYVYDVIYNDDKENPVSSGDASVAVESGTATISREVELLWNPYTLGDANGDDVIDIMDASMILTYYAQVAAGNEPDANLIFDAADIDKNGKIEITDASKTLAFYAKKAAGYTGTFEEYLAEL